MLNQFSRTQLLLGRENIEKLYRAEVDGIYKTSVRPLAKVMRYECKKRRIKKLKVVYSTEKPIRPLEDVSISCRKTEYTRKRRLCAFGCKAYSGRESNKGFNFKTGKVRV